MAEMKFEETSVRKIKRAYCELSKKHHSDRGDGSEQFKEINKAYKKLSNDDDDGDHILNEIIHLYSLFLSQISSIIIKPHALLYAHLHHFESLSYDLGKRVNLKQ
ncbi:hypothetical protein I4U23_009215 [Adineta vaga]|nr:hypothetical protein I4U23_009215 [Adineta vaga]